MCVPSFWWCCTILGLSQLQQQNTRYKLVLTKSGVEWLTYQKSTDIEQAQLKGGHTGARLLSQTLSLCLSLSVFLSVGTFSDRLNPCNGKDGRWLCSAYIRPASKPSRRISGSLQTQSLGSFCLVPLESHAHPCGILLGHTYKVLMMYFRIYQEL